MTRVTAASFAVLVGLAVGGVILLAVGLAELTVPAGARPLDGVPTPPVGDWGSGLRAYAVALAETTAGVVMLGGTVWGLLRRRHRKVR